ncbi:MAG TPA: hypothetical protein VK525_19225 [Candidatus Saccharimonadales bacterium]|nr:hypothetical protein [Candidatus Saccharimonadales bacterium]
MDQAQFESSSLPVPLVKHEANGLAYYFASRGFTFRVFYEIRNDWAFLTKRIEITDAPAATYSVEQITPVKVSVAEKIESAFTPKAYFPQFGPSRDISRLATREFGTFLHFDTASHGLVVIVQNPFLAVRRAGQQVAVSYQPQMEWKKQWGPLQSDLAIIGPYQLSGHRIPAEMTYEWQQDAGAARDDGADASEVEVFRDCVRHFLLHPPVQPISVEVGWTINDYQIDVATAAGQAEYKRIIEASANLGLENILYAPANSDLSRIADDADDWNWEHVLWLGLGQQIRAGTWDPAKSVLPKSVTAIVDYAKSKKVRLLAYVYPSLPFSQNPHWLVSDLSKERKNSFATLASREFQDFLIHELLVFKQRTGISGYSFDYTFLALPGSSSYSQWWGWRRVLEALRMADPEIIIDGRQTYQMYGPWGWLAGNYPHPTGNDEQPESFTPYPDLHFDRVSADRTRFVNYWYRNYQFAPQEIIPGYMTHQTSRNRNLAAQGAGKPAEQSELVYTGFRQRDWDALGFKYSVLSSIATGGWNHVFDMIPARDREEFKHFSATDQAWIRHWLQWTVTNKEFLRNTRTIIGQPAMGQVDGTASIIRDKGFLFLFNPNYKALTARFRLDASIGLRSGEEFLVKEMYPNDGKLVGKPRAGVWNYGDEVTLPIAGTSAMVLELLPGPNSGEIPIFDAVSVDPSRPASAKLQNDVLDLRHVAGEPGTEGTVGVLLRDDSQLKELRVNGRAIAFKQSGRYAASVIRFAGQAFTHSQEVALQKDASGRWDGSFLVPARIRQQLLQRKESWPIPWTKEDYETTWLVPERLLLFVQFTDPDDQMEVKMWIDGRPVDLKRAYSSVRQHRASFVGFYADLSSVAPDITHKIRLQIPEPGTARFQGVFFDNVEAEYTEELAGSMKTD